jgi:hypothetical protein
MTFEIGGHFVPPDPPPTMPDVKHPFTYKMWGPHQMVADERPVPTQTTLSIHTLCNTPLTFPHGKKMVGGTHNIKPSHYFFSLLLPSPLPHTFRNLFRSICCRLQKSWERGTAFAVAKINFPLKRGTTTVQAHIDDT